MIHGVNLSLQFKEQCICKNFSFDVRVGESVCLSAPSGKGKTSILKMIMGIITPKGGEIFINDMGLNSQNILAIRDLFSWLPQNVNLPINSIDELIELLLLDLDDIRYFNSYLEELEISEEVKLHNFSELSGGEKQRIILAACISKQKPILLLDEPASSLDDHSIDLLFKLLNKLKNKTILSTSHNQKWIDNCDRILTL
ncbi:ATP-binding cassette domain-containing protein [Ancylomarina longa]|uniref:ATP-binding cassette domain-containing protein n=1 Tax=Ancylomarina longa TaxID=2487017 RepID=A0A434AGX2_9BACT|nr:ATP-binding cassette domain-containing protein [Ancylomarina longa]RUT73647.1 ATP-binding cassette domain-containing protein [Ancylomarina longa]